MKTNLIVKHGLSLMLGISALAYGASIAMADPLPEPPTFKAQLKVDYVLGRDILEYKAVPEYHDPAWVTEKFVKAGKLPDVKDRLPKEPMVY